MSHVTAPGTVGRTPCAALHAGPGRRPGLRPSAPRLRRAAGGPDGRPPVQQTRRHRILSWDAVPGATQVRGPGRRRPGVAAPMPARSTPPSSHRRTSPPAPLYWRVRAVNRRNEAPAGRARSPLATSALARPLLLARPTGADPRPARPTRRCCRGRRVPGATSLHGRGRRRRRLRRRHVLHHQEHVARRPDPLGEGDWFWRVTAIKGTDLNSLAQRAAATFDVLAARRSRAVVSPPDDANLRATRTSCSTGTPVPGASVLRRPGLDRATTSRRASALIDDQTGILGTRYSPDDDLRQRPVLLARASRRPSDQATPWSAARSSFSRDLADVPTAVHPAATVPRTSRRPHLLRVDVGPPRLRVRAPGRHPARTSPPAPSPAAASPAPPTRPACSPINTTGILRSIRQQRGLRAQGRTDQLLAGAPARPPVHEVGRHPRRPGHLLRDPDLPLPCRRHHRHVAVRRADRRRADPDVGPGHRQRDATTWRS